MRSWSAITICTEYGVFLIWCSWSDGSFSCLIGPKIIWSCLGCAISRFRKWKTYGFWNIQFEKTKFRKQKSLEIMIPKMKTYGFENRRIWKRTSLRIMISKTYGFWKFTFEKTEFRKQTSLEIMISKIETYGIWKSPIQQRCWTEIFERHTDLENAQFKK